MGIISGTKSFIIWIKDQIEWVKAFFQSRDSKKPNISSVLKLIIILAWAQSFLKATAMMKSDGIPSISWEWILFLSAVVGLSQITDIFKLYFSNKIGNSTSKIDKETKDGQ